jgi:hypothetical protein
MSIRTPLVLVASICGAALSVFGFIGAMGGQARVTEAMNVLAITAFVLAAFISVFMFLVQDEKTSTA